MMRKFTYFVILAVIVSCGRLDSKEGDVIGISASIASTGISTSSTRSTSDVSEAKPYRGTTPTAGNSLKAAVWFSDSPTRFDHAPAQPTYLPCRTKMEFESSAIKYADYKPSEDSDPISLRYPTDNDPVYCIGLYPDEGWNSTDGVNITHEINGSDDLMFADVIDGTWDEQMSNQQYGHLLTWIKVSVCAMTMETKEHWGKVKQITIKSKSNVNIDLSSNTERVTYGGADQQITVFNDPTGIELNLTSKEVGSVFCSPATEYEVCITTENYSQKIETIKLSDLNYTEITDKDQTIGKLFILSLYFNPFKIIEGTCTLNYWNDQNEDLFLN